MIAERRSIPVMLMMGDRILPLPDLHPDLRARLTTESQAIVDKEVIEQADFERFGRNMLLLSGEYQSGNMQFGKAYGKDSGDNAWTVSITRNLGSVNEISFDFRNQDFSHGIRWEKGNAHPSSTTTPHEEGIWASSNPQVSTEALRLWLKKAIEVYKNHDDDSYHGDEWKRRQQIVNDRYFHEAIYPKGLRDSYMHWGKRVYLTEDELYFPAPRENILSFARLRRKKTKVF